MTVRDFLHSPNGIAITLLGLLGLALAGLLAGFVFSFTMADRQFRLADLAQRQAAAVAQITVLSAARSGPAELRGALSHYRALIGRETALLAGDAAHAARQRREADRARLLERLALEPGPSGRFHALAAQIRMEEADEVLAVRRELDRLHARTVLFAATLAATALLCAVSAGWLLIRRNRALETVVRARTARLDEVDRSRRLFFAKASHELRTPVTVLRGEAEVALLDPAATPEAMRRSLSHVLASATSLGHRIDELLGLASADDGKLKLARDPVDMGRLFDDAVREAEPLARSVEVTLAASRPGTAVTALGDARWLRQALLAVIDNALKFSPLGGRLELSLSVEHGQAVLSVADHGEGVMPAELPRIFDAYYQTEEGRQRGGSGLGLALARWVVEQHGGRISAANRTEGGCIVDLRLPLAVPA